MDCSIAAAQFFGDIIDNRLCLLGQHRFEANQRSRRERNPEHFLKGLRDFAIADADHVSQVNRHASQTRTNTTVQNLAIARLLHQLVAVVAPGRLMTIQHDSITTVEDVLLQMLCWRKGIHSRHMTLALRTSGRSRDVDGPVVCRRCFSIPSRMADRGSALLFCVRCGRGCRRSRRFAGVPLLLIGGELVLAFQFQFELHLVQLALQPLVFGDEPFDASPFGINRGMQGPPRLFLPIRQQHQRPQRRPAQMRTVADMRTFVFMLGVKTESHRHPSRMPILYADAKFSPRAVPERLICYPPLVFLSFVSLCLWGSIVHHKGTKTQRTRSPMVSVHRFDDHILITIPGCIDFILS